MAESPPRGATPRCTSPPNQSAAGSVVAPGAPAAAAPTAPTSAAPSGPTGAPRHASSRLAAIATLLLAACLGHAADPPAAAPPTAPTPPAATPTPAAAPAPAPTPPQVTPTAAPTPAAATTPTPAPAPPILDRLLPYGPDREALTVAYLRAHRTAPLTGDTAVDTRMTPRVIVLHWTAGPSADSAWNTFASARLSGRADLAHAGALNVGAHYLVDRDGTITRMVPEDRVVRHCIGLNHVAIGIENVGGGAEWPLTPAQVDANAALVRWISARQPITHLIGHLEYRGLEGHPYFEERDPTYRTTKPDPGAAFLQGVRARVADLGLSGP